MGEVLAYLENLKPAIVCCLIVLVSEWVYLLYSQAYGAFACMTVFVLICAYAMMDDFVTNHIAARDDFLLPDVE